METWNHLVTLQGGGCVGTEGVRNQAEHIPVIPETYALDKSVGEKSLKEWGTGSHSHYWRRARTAMALQTGVLEDDKRGHASGVALEMPGGLFPQSSLKTGSVFFQNQRLSAPLSESWVAFVYNSSCYANTQLSLSKCSSVFAHRRVKIITINRFRFYIS